MAPGEDLPVVDVGPRGAAVVVVGEVSRVQPAEGGRGAVHAEPDLEHPHLQTRGKVRSFYTNQLCCLDVTFFSLVLRRCSWAKQMII